MSFPDDSNHSDSLFDEDFFQELVRRPFDQDDHAGDTVEGNEPPPVQTDSMSPLVSDNIQPQARASTEHAQGDSVKEVEPQVNPLPLCKRQKTLRPIKAKSTVKSAVTAHTNAQAIINTTGQLTNKPVQGPTTFRAILPKPEGYVEPKKSIPEPDVHFKCTFKSCSKSYTQMRHLEVHVKAKHQVEKMFHCTWPSCAKVCSRASYVEEHIRLFHLKIPKSVAEQEKKGMIRDKGLNIKKYYEIVDYN